VDPDQLGTADGRRRHIDDVFVLHLRLIARRLEAAATNQPGGARNDRQQLISTHR